MSFSFRAIIDGLPWEIQPVARISLMALARDAWLRPGGADGCTRRGALDAPDGWVGVTRFELRADHALDVTKVQP